MLNKSVTFLYLTSWNTNLTCGSHFLAVVFVHGVSDSGVGGNRSVT